MFADIDLFYFSNLIFQKNIYIVEEERDCIDIDDIGKLKNSPRLVFINTECTNLIVVNDDEELTRNINKKTFYNSL